MGLPAALQAGTIRELFTSMRIPVRTFLLFLGLCIALPALAQSAASARIPSADQDLAWLNRHLDANAAGSRRVVVHTGTAIPFNSLPDRVGARIGVTLRDGRSRYGVLESASSQRARLRVRLAAGEYMFDFARADVQRITGGDR
jgi:hypothetical protein